MTGLENESNNMGGGNNNRSKRKKYRSRGTQTKKSLWKVKESIYCGECSDCLSDPYRKQLLNLKFK